MKDRVTQSELDKNKYNEGYAADRGISMIKIALCDDVKDELEEVDFSCKDYINKNPNLSVLTKAFTDVKKLMMAFEKGQRFDIIILAVSMKSMNGIDVARKIRLKDKKCQLIFITKTKDYAVDAFNLNACHYLLKPFDPDSFCQALDKAFSNLEMFRKNSFNLRTSIGFKTILFKNIIFIETKGNYQMIHLLNGKILKVRMTSLMMFKELSHDKRFYKYGVSFILNLNKILEVNKETIILHNQTVLNMQRRQYKDLLNYYKIYGLVQV